MTCEPGLVVVGASLAGVRAAEAARRAGYAGGISVLDADAHEPYDRPPLSKAFLVEPLRKVPTILSHQDADRLGIDLRLGERAVSLDPQARAVHLENSSLRYDRLVIATGCAARRLGVPGADIPGVHYLRNLDDAHRFRLALVKAQNVVIVGGGFIGVEVATSLLELKKRVKVVERASSLLGLLGSPLSSWVEQRYRELGGDLHVGTHVAEIVGDTRVRSVVLGGGETLTADLVLVGVGAVPRTEWLESSGVALGDGVLCSPQLETSLPDVFAAGDVARWESRRLGQSTRVEHWSNAIMQGIVAGTNAADRASTREFDDVPYFWSDLLGVRIQVAGRLGRWDQHLVALEDSTGTVHTYCSDGQVVGVVARDAQRDFAKHRRRVGTAISA